MSGEGIFQQSSPHASFIRLQRFENPHPSQFSIGHSLQPPATPQIAAVNSKQTRRKGSNVENV